MLDSNELEASQIENINYKQNRDQIGELNNQAKVVEVVMPASEIKNKKCQQNKQNDL